MAGPVAVLDADVVVPILSCDLPLTACDHDLYESSIGLSTRRWVADALEAAGRDVGQPDLRASSVNGDHERPASLRDQLLL